MSHSNGNVQLTAHAMYAGDMYLKAPLDPHAFGKAGTVMLDHTPGALYRAILTYLDAAGVAANEDDAKRMQFLVKYGMELQSCECDDADLSVMWCVVNRTKPNEGSVWHSHPYIAIDEARRKKGEL